MNVGEMETEDSLSLLPAGAPLGPVVVSCSALRGARGASREASGSFRNALEDSAV